MKSKYLITIIIVIVVIVIAVVEVGVLQRTINLANGQSLADLENEVDTQLGYRGELENYIVSHNISLAPLNAHSMDMLTLESFVKAHMKKCKSGEHDSYVGFIEETYKDNKTKSELLASTGDC